MSRDNNLRELFLVRHAKSDWKTPTPDIERPISEKGKKAANRLGDWLEKNDISPDYILVSPAKRTQQTLKRLNVSKDIKVKTLDTLYLAERDQLINILSQVPPQYEKVMMIGHNPGFEALRQYLEKKPDCRDCEADLFPTGTFAHFVLPTDWQNLSPGAGKLMQFIRPKDTKSSPN